MSNRTEEIPDYVIREMADPAGGYYSTQDANSEGEEGKFCPGGLAGRLRNLNASEVCDLA